MKIDWKVRLKNPVFYIQMVLAIMTPVLAYMGKTAQDISSWKLLGEVIIEAVKNPYILALVAISVWNAINDPTTKGIGDGISLNSKNKSYLKGESDGDKQ